MFLVEQKAACRKVDIAKNCRLSVHTVAKSLAELGRDGYVDESAGWYIATAKGKLLAENEIDLLRFKTQKEILSNLPWAVIERNPACRHVIDIQQHLVGDEILKIDLLPFVLMWLAANGKTLRRFDSELTATDPEYGQIVDQFLTKLYRLRENNED